MHAQHAAIERGGVARTPRPSSFAIAPTALRTCRTRSFAHTGSTWSPSRWSTATSLRTGSISTDTFVEWLRRGERRRRSASARCVPRGVRPQPKTASTFSPCPGPALGHLCVRRTAAMFRAPDRGRFEGRVADRGIARAPRGGARRSAQCRDRRRARPDPRPPGILRSRPSDNLLASGRPAGGSPAVPHPADLGLTAEAGSTRYQSGRRGAPRMLDLIRARDARPGDRPVESSMSGARRRRHRTRSRALPRRRDHASLASRPGLRTPAPAHGDRVPGGGGGG